MPGAADVAANPPITDTSQFLPGITSPNPPPSTDRWTQPVPPCHSTAIWRPRVSRPWRPRNILSQRLQRQDCPLTPSRQSHY